MCGIAGYVGKGTASDIERMIGSIRYRGPDAQGIYCGDGFGLGHARLSIIDLSPSGAQPMWNMAKTIGVVFNGEIYNYRDLKKELLVEGYTFQGTSDTEVIIGLYQKYGEACFQRLNGMFAIAIFDMTKNTLLLARDRMGKKPLYYGVFQDTLLFASEPKAIFEHPLAVKEIDLVALNAYLALDYVPTPLSIYKGIKKLEPASCLVYEHGLTRMFSFWSLVQGTQITSLEDAVRALDVHIEQATASRLVADVPLGIFLSGGLDSSTIAYYAARSKKEPIHTFSIGFSESSFDESDYAVEVSGHVHSVHHHKKISGQDSLEVIPEIYSRLDEPMADASIIPTYLLARFTKEHVTVALGGDGGDELFAGYPTFQAERVYQILKYVPVRISSVIIYSFLRFIPPSSAYMSLEFKLRKFVEGLGESHIARRHMKWLGTWNTEERSRILCEDVRHKLNDVEPYESALRYFDESPSSDERNKLLYMYQRTFMMDQVMVKVDRASMYPALEARAPFLDMEVVEFVNSLPYEYKLRGMNVKHILKKLMDGKLPYRIIHRRKKGFGVPVADWLRGPLRGWGESLLEEDRLIKGGLFDPVQLRLLWDEHQSGGHDHRKKLWNILVFLEWQKNFL